MGVRASGGGQGCFWFSQGCSIGCAECTGIGSHSNVSICNSTMQPTLPDYARTMNLQAKAGSRDDVYRFNPWRAPGTAPTFDACGRAGGTSKENYGPGDAYFTDTVFAKGGELGSEVLPPAPSGTIWTTGAEVEVAWGSRYNHGGGYIYRLCPASEQLTEECFFRTPLEFVRTGQQLEWANGTRYPIEGTWVDEGTYPGGSTWAMNPIPRINFDSHSSGQPADASGCEKSPVTGGAVGPNCRQFDPPCPQDTGWVADPKHKGTDMSGQGECSGDWTRGSVVDRVRVPHGLAPGDYVLSWRWDCEESTQVWSACADVSVVAPSARAS